MPLGYNGLARYIIAIVCFVNHSLHVVSITVGIALARQEKSRTLGLSVCKLMTVYVLSSYIIDGCSIGELCELR